MSWIARRRPSLRFAPQAGWINDPNGLIFDGKRYHLFAQHNPDATVWGPMHWLHAVSEDLTHWEELGIALYPDPLGTMFSGSAVIDHHNTAGFGAGAMVLMFTQHGDAQTQGIAHSLDGERFTVYPGNPVIENPGIPDFRDPKVFWDALRNHWAMALAAGDCIEFYASADLMNWRKTGEFGKTENRLSGVFECPDLFPLAAPDGREVWVLLVSMGASPEQGGCRIQYFLGDYDGNAFAQTEAVGQVLMLDRGFDDYAGVTFSGTEDRLFLGWAANAMYAGNVPAGAFRGSFTLPRKLFLMNTRDGTRLGAQPVLPALPNRPRAEGAYEICLRASGAFALTLANDQGDALRIGLDDQDNIYMDRTNAGDAAFHEWFGKPLYSVTRAPRLLDGTLEMRVVVDHTLVEVYAEDGAYVASALVFPKAPYDHMELRGAVEA